MAWISVDGPVDRNIPPADDVLKGSISNETRIVVLDFSKAGMINSEGLDWLDDVRAHLDSDGIRLRVVAPQGGKVRRILSLMQYDRAVLLLDRLADAVRVGKKRYLRIRFPRKQKRAGVEQQLAAPAGKP
jgi:hypothetical protein